MRYKLLIAIFASLLVHAILIFNLTFFNSTNVLKRNFFEGELTTPNLSVPVLQVGFLVLSKPKNLSMENKKTPIAFSENSGKIYAVVENSHKVQMKPQESNQGLPLTPTDKNISNSNVTQLQYFKPNEVDISAIPVRGIEPPIPITVNKLLAVYKMRVFINKNGSVDQVLNLNQDDTEQIFYSNIEEQIKKLTFIPAKKNGIEVDSYIEIALEF
jgi:hypothetical protein